MTFKNMKCTTIVLSFNVMLTRLPILEQQSQAMPEVYKQLNYLYLIKE